MQQGWMRQCDKKVALHELQSIVQELVSWRVDEIPACWVDAERSWYTNSKSSQEIVLFAENLLAVDAPVDMPLSPTAARASKCKVIEMKRTIGGLMWWVEQVSDRKYEVEPSVIVDMAKDRVRRKSHTDSPKHKYHSVCPNVFTHHHHPQVPSF